MATDHKILSKTIYIIDRCLKLSIFGLIFSFFIVLYAHGEEFISTNHKFKLSYPPTLEIIDLKISNAPLALRTVAHPYPTVNILVQPGPYKWDNEHKSEQQRVIESYSGVGILDARLVESSVVYIKGVRQFRAKIIYAYNNLRLASLVAIISASDRHFIITCIDYVSAMPLKQGQFTAILDSFELIGDEPINKTVITTSNQAKIANLIVITLCLIAICSFAYYRSGPRK